MANLILREMTGNAGDTTIGAPLTNAQVDGNFINLDVELTALKTDLAAGAGSSLSGYSAGTYAIPTTVQTKLRETVSVLDFGADPTGVADSTTAFNLATTQWIAHSGDTDKSMLRDIYVPPGEYRIHGTVYVRRGQRLYGSAEGTSRINSRYLVGEVETSSTTGRRTFILGFGFIASVLTADAGTLPIVIENLNVVGGDTTGVVVDGISTGSIIRDIKFSGTKSAIRVLGNDTIVSNCYFDSVGTGITVNGVSGNDYGQNQIIRDCKFKQTDYGVVFLSHTFDTQVNNCHFANGGYADIIFGDAATNIKNVSISNCQFTKDNIYATSFGAILVQSNSADANIRGCDFRNQSGYSISCAGASFGNIIRVTDCTFNGKKTNPSYIESLTSGGINIRDCEFEITNCRFENLAGLPINVPAAHDTAFNTVVRDCLFKVGTMPVAGIVTGEKYTILTVGTTNFTSISVEAVSNTVGLTFTANATVPSGTGTVSNLSYINLEGLAGVMEMYNNKADGVLPLFNIQTIAVPMAFKARGNLNWLGQAKVSGGRAFWLIPTNQAAIVQVGIIATTGGDSRYRYVSSLYASRKIGLDVATFKDYASEHLLYETPAAGAVVIDTAVALDSVGGPVIDTFVYPNRNLVVSIPSTYTSYSIEADYIASY